MWNPTVEITNRGNMRNERTIAIENDHDVTQRIIREGSAEIQKAIACLDDLQSRASSISWELMLAKNSIEAARLARQARGLAEALTNLTVVP